MTSTNIRKMGAYEYFLSKMYAYNKSSESVMAVVCQIEKHIDFSLFKKAWDSLFLRHPLLQATRKIKEKNYYFEFNASFNDILIQHIKSKKQDDWQQILNQIISEPIDISQNFWRATLISSPNNLNSHIIFAADHSICDGISLGWLLGEFTRIIMALEKGKPVSKDSYPIPPAVDEMVDYSHFTPSSQPKMPEPTYHHFDEPCTLETAQNNIIFRKVGKKDLIAVLSKCKKYNVTFTHFMIAALAKSVYKTKNQKEGVFNIPYSISLRKFTQPKTNHNILMDCAGSSSIQLSLKSQQTLWKLATQAKTLIKNNMKQHDLAGILASLRQYADEYG